MIPLVQVNMASTAAEAVGKVLNSGWIAQGKRVDAFEDALEPYLGRHPVTVNSGTMALQLALRLAGVTPGGEVISTPMTCSATNLAIVAAGADIRWADINPITGLIDPDDVFRKVGKRTQAVMCVDWGGTPCDLDMLSADARYVLIEDAAHAFGASYEGQPVGSHSEFVCFSFQAIKHLTTGDGGALTCYDPMDVDDAKRLRWFGIDRESPVEFRGALDIEDWGYKAHMNDIAATIGLQNLTIIDDVLAAHRRNAAAYDELLPARYGRPWPTDYEFTSAAWVYTTLVPADRRDQFAIHMKDRGIQVSQMHWRNDRLTVFRPYAEENLPGVDSFSERMICLPTHRGTDVEAVVEAMEAFVF